MDRTGQLAIVVSAGTGEFYVDRQLTNITKQRILDNGVGIDLICVGQEPLYAVPLFLVRKTYHFLEMLFYLLVIFLMIVKNCKCLVWTFIFLKLCLYTHFMLLKKV